MEEQYSNSLELNTSFYDITTKFRRESTIINSQGENVSINDEIISIRMSLQLAKAYHKLLGENIEKYESVYGKIPDSPIAPSPQNQSK